MSKFIDGICGFMVLFYFILVVFGLDYFSSYIEKEGLIIFFKKYSIYLLLIFVFSFLVLIQRFGLISSVSLLVGETIFVFGLIEAINDANIYEILFGVQFWSYTGHLVCLLGFALILIFIFMEKESDSNKEKKNKR